jgi:hypothetical protein
MQVYNRIPTPLPPFMLLVLCALLIKKAKAHEAFISSLAALDERLPCV